MAPTPGEGQASTSRFRWLLGTLLALVTLTWLLYPLRPLEKAQVLHRDPVSYQCGDDETVRNVAIIGGCILAQGTERLTDLLYPRCWLRWGICSILPEEAQISMSAGQHHRL